MALQAGTSRIGAIAGLQEFAFLTPASLGACRVGGHAAPGMHPDQLLPSTVVGVHFRQRLRLPARLGEQLKDGMGLSGGGEIRQTNNR